MRENSVHLRVHIDVPEKVEESDVVRPGEAVEYLGWVNDLLGVRKALRRALAPTPEEALHSSSGQLCLRLPPTQMVVSQAAAPLIWRKCKRSACDIRIGGGGGRTEGITRRLRVKTGRVWLPCWEVSPVYPGLDGNVRVWWVGPQIHTIRPEHVLRVAYCS
jgi:hypothetical protein